MMIPIEGRGFIDQGSTSLSPKTLNSSFHFLGARGFRVSGFRVLGFAVLAFRVWRV